MVFAVATAGYCQHEIQPLELSIQSSKQVDENGAKEKNKFITEARAIEIAKKVAVGVMNIPTDASVY